MPSVAISQPTSSTNWKRGQTETITWSAVPGFGNTVSSFVLKLYKANTYQFTIATVNGSSSSYNWTIPASLNAGTNYRVHITMNYSGGGGMG
jgi:hypothetical protein